MSASPPYYAILPDDVRQLTEIVLEARQVLSRQLLNFDPGEFPMSQQALITRTILLFAPLVVLSQPNFPVERLTIRADISAELREVHGTIGTSVSTPFGALPVSGRAQLAHSCDGTFAGTVSYSFLVRLGARVKGIALVSAMEGHVAPSRLSNCSFATGELSGQFRISDSTLTGSIRASADSLPIQGVVRAIGDTAYQVELTVPAFEAADTVFVNLYARR
ncbi:MAG TPA: hypothetical protein VMM77_00200 [Gemmatimonadaceae bacterium]|nr:hypothetical protein [Gemmatimonadaceae bacterium]